MTSRTLPAAAFVLLCLGLSGLVLRRQMAAHPIRPDQAGRERGEGRARAFENQLAGRPGAHVADERTGRAIVGAIRGQLTAFRAADGSKAMSYQSRGLRRGFGSPQGFVEGIRHGYPEFGDSTAVRFAPVWVDGAGRFAEVVVTVRGANGRQARGDYEMVKEDGVYRVAGVRGGGPARD